MRQARISLLRCFLGFESDTDGNDLNIKSVLNITERLDCIPSVMVDIIPSTNKYEYIKLKKVSKGQDKTFNSHLSHRKEREDRIKILQHNDTPSNPSGYSSSPGVFVPSEPHGQGTCAARRHSIRAGCAHAHPS